MNLESAIAAFATAAALVSDSANKVMPSVISEAQKFSQSILRESGSVASILAKQNNVVASQIVTEGGLLQTGAIKCPRPIVLTINNEQTPVADSLRYDCILETIYGHVPFVASLKECPELPLGTLGVAGLGAMAAPGAVAGSVLGAMGVEDNGLIAGLVNAATRAPAAFAQNILLLLRNAGLGGKDVIVVNKIIQADGATQIAKAAAKGNTVLMYLCDLKLPTL